MPWWTGALSLPVDDLTLGVEATNTVLQARVRANALFTTLFVGFAVLVFVAFKLVAFLGRLALIALGAEAHRAMVRHATLCPEPAGRVTGQTGIRALATDAR